MTTQNKVLVETVYASNAETTQYTAPASTRTIIDKFTATNVTGAAATLTVKLVPYGSSASTANIITNAQSIAAGAVYSFPEVAGHVLAAGDFISTIASVASALVIRSSGREVS